MFFTPLVQTSREISAALSRHVEPAAEASLRQRAAAARPHPPFGSGEAELVALVAGLKPLARQLLSDDALDALRAHLAAAPDRLEYATAPFGPGRTAVFLARSRDVVEAAVRAEVTPDNRALGALLGYPACCIDAFAQLDSATCSNLDLARAAAGRTGDRPFEPRLNGLDLGVFHYVPWAPCTFDCEPSRRYADAVATALGRTHVGWAGLGRSHCEPGCAHERFVADTDRALAAHRLVVTDAVQVSLRGAFDGELLRVEDAWPTFLDRPPRANPDEADRDAAIHLAAAALRRGTLALRDGKLYLGGKAVLRQPAALFAPFGGRSR